MILEFLEKQHLVNCSLPPLARRYGLTKEVAWDILEHKASEIETKVLSPDAEVHLQVKEWYSTNRNNLATFGLNVLKNQKPKASDLNYGQLICIVMLDEYLANAKQILRENIQEPVKKLSWFQRFSDWLRKFRPGLFALDDFDS